MKMTNLQMSIRLSNELYNSFFQDEHISDCLIVTDPPYELK